MMRGILGRILIVAGIMGIAHQGALLVAPHWFGGVIEISVSNYDPVTSTAYYTDASFNVGIQLNISELTPGPNDALVITTIGKDREVPAHDGETVNLGANTYTVRAADYWTGLMSDPQGEPMVQLSLQRDGDVWVSDLQLNERTELRVGELDVRFEISGESETQAPGPRWGIVDEGNTIWFDDIIEGTGYETADGTVYTLVGHRAAQDGDPAMIAVIAQPRDGDPVRHVVMPETDNPVIKFESPDPHAPRLAIRPVDAFDVAGTLYRGAEVVARVELEPGVPVELEGTEFRVRLDQYEDKAVPVTDDAAVLAVALESDARRFEVRQGVAVRVDDATTVRYKLDPSLAKITYVLNSSLFDEPLELDSADAPFAIKTGIGLYRATPGPALNLDPLVCMYTPAASLGVVIAAIFMLISGAAFTMLARPELSSDA